jgi:SAM-dependent methyltransferase
MESEAETARLLVQEEANPVRAHLTGTGLSPGHRALDAGCGPGAIAQVMAEIVGPRGEVVGIDASAERVAQAQKLCAPHAHCRFHQGDIQGTGLPAEHFDYVWSQFVFEYLPRPEAALDELIRVTRKGGRIVVSEIDGVGLHNWPFPPMLEDGFARLLRGVSAAGFDIHVGRKLFHLFHKAGLKDLRVQLHPLWVVAGAADDRLVEDWRVRLTALAPLARPQFDSDQAWQAFFDGYLALLRAPDALKYAVLLVTEGTRR